MHWFNKMHFSIPESKPNKSGFSTYQTYDIYINGTFHCSLRYRQLFQFHEQLRKQFGAQNLYPFPPKKIFPLSPPQVEERRARLEKYIQIASQDSQIVNSELFNSFLLSAQQTTHPDLGPSECPLEIYQLNWQPIQVRVKPSENSQHVLRKYTEAINLRSDHLPYFALYLVRRVSNDYKTVRRLQNFESPLLTLKTINRCTNSTGSSTESRHIIIIRKSYWNNAFDEDLVCDKVALNILYLQALHDVEKGYVEANSEIRMKLTSLQAKGDKVEYLNIARSLKFYGYIYFEPCYCDFFSPKSIVKLSAGNNELNMRLLVENEEYSFRVIRIKCWRLTTSTGSNSESSTQNIEDGRGRFELSFEYLFDKTTLKWITIYSSQAVLISFCLQSMVEEMLLKREGKKFRSEGLALRYNTSPNLGGPHSDSLVNGNETNGSSNSSSIRDSTLTDQNSPSASFGGSTDSSEVRPLGKAINARREQFNLTGQIENGVFDEIGDEDL